MQTDPFEITGTTCVVVLLVLVIWILVSIWVFRDARSRGMNGALWLVVVLVGSLIGLILYIVLREEKRGKSPADESLGYEHWQRHQSSDLQSPQALQTDGGRMCGRCGAHIGPKTKFCPVCGQRT